MKCVFFFSCDDSDSVTVSIVVNGGADKIGTYCGSRLPPMLMSNEPKLTVIFQSVQSSATVTGFKAKYKFVRGEAEALLLFWIQVIVTTFQCRIYVYTYDYSVRDIVFEQSEFFYSHIIIKFQVKINILSLLVNSVYIIESHTVEATTLTGDINVYYFPFMALVV